MGTDVLLRELGLQGSLQGFILVIGLILGRLIPILTLNPMLGGHVMPQNAKIGFSLMIAALVYQPVLASFSHPVPEAFLPYVALLIKEILFGTALGYLSSLVFYAIQTGGRIIDMSRGASMAFMLAPQTEGQVSYLGEMQFQFSIVLFFALNGHRLFFQAIFQSFDLVPLVDFPDFVKLTGPTIHLLAWSSGQVLHIAVLLAAPVVVAMLLTDLVFGIINRVSPQINVFFLAMPVKMMLGLVVVLFVMGFLSEQMAGYFSGMIRDVSQLIRIF